MRAARQLKQTKCMTCGAPVNTGFFCAKCIDLGAKDESATVELWKGRRFTEERKKKAHRQMLRQDLTVWSKRLVAIAVAALVFLGGWKVFGDRIQTEFREATDVFKPADRTDPTKAHPVQLDTKGNPVGTDRFSRKYNR